VPRLVPRRPAPGTAAPTPEERVETMRTMKLRLLIMGGVISALAAIFLLARGAHGKTFVLLGIGVVLLLAGVLWPSPRP
jgi:uncharacterized membrane protein HdeD (DUF308 family)